LKILNFSRRYPEDFMMVLMIMREIKAIIPTCSPDMARI